MEQINLITCSQLEQIIRFLHQALLSTTSQNNNEQHVQIYNQITRLEQYKYTYVGLCVVLCGLEYQYDLRYIAGLTMNSALKRNPQILFIGSLQRQFIYKKLIAIHQQFHKNNLNLNNNDNKQNNSIIKIINMILNQILIFTGHIDYQIINQLLIMMPNTINNFIMLFQDLKYLQQNYILNSNNNNNSYNNQNQFISFVGTLFQKCMQYIHLLNYSNSLNCFQCMNIMIFYLNGNQRILIQQYLCNILQEYYSVSLQQNDSNILRKVMEALYQIVQTKPQILLDQQQWLIIIYNLNVQSDQQIMKLWCEILMQLFEHEPLILQQNCTMIIYKLIEGCTFQHEDLIQIKDDMQLEFNPYLEEGEEQNNNYETSYGKCGSYTIRKVCIMCLQKMALHYNDLWQLCKNKCSEMLQHNKFQFIQIGILIIGILAQHNLQAIMSEKNTIITFLFSKLGQNGNQEPNIIQATTYYTLQKLYHGYQQHQQVIIACLNYIIKHLSSMLQTDGIMITMVTQASISLLDQILSHLRQYIPIPLLSTINSCLITCLQSFSGRPLYNTFKAITSVFQNEHIRPSTDQVRIYIEQLCGKWGKNSRLDSIMCPLIETMVIICQNCGSTFNYYVLDIFQQLILILKQQTDRKAVLLRVMDLISAIIALKNDKIQQFINQQQFNSIMLGLISNKQLQIRHFAYAVLSDIVKVQKLTAYVRQYLQVIINMMNKDSLTSTNNALLCLTDLLFQHPEFSIQHVQYIGNAAIFMLTNYNLERIYAMNFAKILGIMCFLQPYLCKQFVIRNIKIISMSLRCTQSNYLTDYAYLGLFRTLQSFNEIQLQSIIPQIHYIIDGFICYNYIDRNVELQFRTLLSRLCQVCSEMKWRQILNQPIFLPGTVNKIKSLLC